MKAKKLIEDFMRAKTIPFLSNDDNDCMCHIHGPIMRCKYSNRDNCYFADGNGKEINIDSVYKEEK
jgi:hypothetical protein